MDPEKRISRSIGAMNKSLNMDLKDIIKEHTLPFLPAKSLLRFRAVCWDWNRRISSPFFAHNQSHFFRTLSGFLCQPREGLPSFISLDPNSYGIPEASLEFLQVPVDIKASSNGLLCCQARTDERSYYICNPVNKQWKVLPKPTCDHGPNPALVLIFDQPLQNFAVDYKLVCAFPSSDFDDGHEFEIYSSETGMWKLSGEICFGNRKLDPDSGVHVKGIVYWMSNNYIVAYDLTKDRSRLIDSFGLENGCLGVMHGELCYANMNKLTVWVKKMSNFYSNTMEMGSGNRTWSKKHRFTFENTSEKETDIKTWALLFVGDGLVVAQVGEDKIAACDVKTSEITVLSRTVGDGKLRCFPYVNSLVSLL